MGILQRLRLPVSGLPTCEEVPRALPGQARQNFMKPVYRKPRGPPSSRAESSQRSAPEPEAEDLLAENAPQWVTCQVTADTTQYFAVSQALEAMSPGHQVAGWKSSGHRARSNDKAPSRDEFFGNFC